MSTPCVVCITCCDICDKVNLGCSWLSLFRGPNIGSSAAFFHGARKEFFGHSWEGKADTKHNTHILFNFNFLAHKP